MSRIVALFCAVLAVSTVVQAQAKKNLKDEVQQSETAAQVFREIMDAPDKGIPQEMLDNAECVAVFPSVLQAGFVFAGRGAGGVASCRTATGWSAPAYFNLGGGSFGLQIGAQSTDFVMLVLNKDGLSSLLSDAFTLGADASVAAGPVGRQAGASTDLKFSAQILSYSRSKGLFAGLELKGVVIKPDKDDMRDVYGEGITASEVLKANKITAPVSVRAFPIALSHFSSRVDRSDQVKLSAERRQAGDNIVQAYSETDRARTEADRASSDASRARIEAAFAMAVAAEEAAMARDRLAHAQSETAKAKANEGQARGDAESARLQAEETKRERDAAQQRLHISLSEILETRREPRGLIVNLSDVLFDTGQATLKAGAKERLSKLAGTLLAYPGAYQIEIEGHTDSVGSNASNLNLSRGRAESVRDYLVQNGIKSEHVIAARGFGDATPVADNKTAAGRQVNRRVEIIIADHPESQAKAGTQ